jgi:dolichol-phosphate mannosyltransferase
MKPFDRYRSALARHLPYAWRFGAVGASGVLVNHGLFTALTSSGLGPVPSSLAAVEASIAGNFVLNDVWTFRGLGRGGRLRRIALFHLSRAAGAAVNIAAVAILTGLGVYPDISNLVGIGLAVTANYLSSVGVVWRVG